MSLPNGDGASVMVFPFSSLFPLDLQRHNNNKKKGSAGTNEKRVRICNVKMSAATFSNTQIASQRKPSVNRVRCFGLLGLISAVQTLEQTHGKRQLLTTYLGG